MNSFNFRKLGIFNPLLGGSADSQPSMQPQSPPQTDYGEAGQYQPTAPPISEFVNPQHLHYNPTANTQHAGIQHAERAHLPDANNFHQPPQYHALPSTAQYLPQMQDLTYLGPTQSRKPARPSTPPSAALSAAQHTSPTTPRWDPKTLLGGQAVNGVAPMGNLNSRTSGQGSRSTSEEAQEVGMSHFMNNIYRTTNRDQVPHQRKRKIDANPEEEPEGSPESKKAKSTFSGASSNGLLGKHLKEEREKQAAVSGPATGPIDLTLDDDEPVVTGEKTLTTQAHDDNEVCMGVVETKAMLSRIPNYSAKQKDVLGKDTWPVTRLDYRRKKSQDNKIELLDRTGGKVVGTIEIRLASALCPILDGPVKLRLKVHLRQWKRKNGSHIGQHVSENADILVLLYAPRKHTQRISVFLSQKGIYLGTPAKAGVNDNSEVEVPGMRTAGYGSSGGRPQTHVSVKGRTEEEMRREAETMFEKVKHDDLPRRMADAKLINKTLMDHQQQALHFMLCLETNTPLNEGDEEAFSLWKPNVNHRGDRTWVHVITDQEVDKRPNPFKGGILADMMGLGKTLSILSLVAETRREASVFGRAAAPASSHTERNAQTTLIVCPKSVLSNWKEQIDMYFLPKRCTYYMYHGAKRNRDLDSLADYDIVMTTYDTAAADFKSKTGALHAINWFRVVLDEAHTIRNQDTFNSKACIALSADRRWAVTGTPIQNTMNDLAALVKFLRVEPFSDTHSWNQYILAPLRAGNSDAVAHLRLLVDGITLRRMKDKIAFKARHEKDITIDLPAEERRIYERIASQSNQQMNLMTGGNTHKMKGKSYAHMLRLIDRMRRFCAHGLDMFSDEDRKEIEEGMNADNAIDIIDLGDDPALEEFKFITDKSALEQLQLASESSTDQCERCGDSLIGGQDDAEYDSDEDGTPDGKKDLIGHLTPCFHFLCTKCKPIYIQQAQSSMTTDQRHGCPLCQAYVRFGFFDYYRSKLQEYIEDKRMSIKKRRERAANRLENYEKPSVKVQHLIDDLRNHELETDLLPDGEPPIRSVVFSQWTTYLDLIEVALVEAGICFVRLDGTMTISQRTSVLKQFKTSPLVSVILVSIKAGGQGLNLTSANHVYMMEPQYNPGVEQQAIDRVHRLGQERDVYVNHFFINESIEQKIQLLQRRKQDLANLTLEKRLDKAEAARKRIEELRDLFR
ncbi:hypothetical protein LTR62_004296 [Meristemomyces frigidus]|uniref:Uncharacterized protein n=1 Tax=Meristemomyces frigidus TaxID=1508187 RepID=A0AAN7TE29_9PEZI|nr:hypothetical protein LTR62_004296 [Meristemomyces frigidus]